ncbi:methyltransferase-like protein [Xylaria sp. CBS 124048]|nr:methyltransferase-like protein [Xylaria sp. CBS 124048]
MAAAAVAIPSGPVEGMLFFSGKPPAGEVAYQNIDTPTGEPQSNVEKIPYTVPITDIRGHEGDYNLDHDAFQAIVGLPPSKEVDFIDDESIKKNYYPEVEKLLLEAVPGSTRVFIFDHTIRRPHADSSRKAVRYVHIDQTTKAAKVRVHRHMGDEAEKLLQGRYRIINVWRPLNKKPLESTPLAFASSASVDQKDVLPTELRTKAYTGETASIFHNPEQKWYYLSGMTGNERVLLECFDSEALKEGSNVKGGRVPHTAFDHPLSPPNAEGRESIEVRTLVFGP